MYLEKIDIFKNDGIVKIKNFLNKNELQLINKNVEKFIGQKGSPETYFSTNHIENFTKLLRFNFKKFLSSNILLKISKKKQMKKFADLAFGKKSYLNMIDGYFSPISSKEVLPWHIDQAYSGKIFVGEDEIINPKIYSIKFFIYLTKVGSDNGCTSYIPGTNKITHALRNGLKEKKLKYSPHWTLHDLRKFVLSAENYNYFKNYFFNTNILDEFLKKTSFINSNIDNKEFDFELEPGDAIIFDECGVHKGSKILINNRKVLRFHYSPQL
jgi:hypothetical protein